MSNVIESAEAIVTIHIKAAEAIATIHIEVAEAMLPGSDLRNAILCAPKLSLRDLEDVVLTVITLMKKDNFLIEHQARLIGNEHPKSPEAKKMIANQVEKLHTVLTKIQTLIRTLIRTKK